jgi:hypothetical protein
VLRLPFHIKIRNRPAYYYMRFLRNPGSVRLCTNSSLKVHPAFQTLTSSRVAQAASYYSTPARVSTNTNQRSDDLT